MFKARLVLMIVLAAFVMAPVQADVTVLDDMNDIFARPWTDDREPGEGGIGLLQQGAGTMVLDWGNTTDSTGTPHPDAGYDYQGNWVGHANLSGGAFNSGGGGQDIWDSGYRGKYDRVPSASFAPGEIPALDPNIHYFRATRSKKRNVNLIKKEDEE